MLRDVLRQRPGAARRKRPLPPNSELVQGFTEDSPTSPSASPTFEDGLGRPCNGDFLSCSGLSHILGPSSVNWCAGWISKNALPGFDCVQVEYRLSSGKAVFVYI